MREKCYEWTENGAGHRCRNWASDWVIFDSGDGVPMCGLHATYRIERTDATRVTLPHVAPESPQTGEPK